MPCRDEKDQTELLGRLKEEGRECKALLVRGIRKYRTSHGNKESVRMNGKVG
jgi:hypothetical protein